MQANIQSADPNVDSFLSVIDGLQVRSLIAIICHEVCLN